MIKLMIGVILVTAMSAVGHSRDADSATTAMPNLTIDDSSTTNPWTHLQVNNSPMNFQFAIVTDRTGGLRPGIFDDAVKKLNLLQPEFVMSVGDLISGYTRDRKVLNREWNEFEGFVNSLTMPFFYVPGNHDMSNDVQKEIWNERFGRPYYHFVYGDVLFLCLNSEDPANAIGREQIDYFARALEENADARWTLVFLHKPLWVRAGDLAGEGAGGNLVEGDPSGSGWSDIEALLKGRRYNVFAGHLHRYAKHVRNSASHIVLATTGGGTRLRGARPYGEFDHVVWVTMTDDGPILANIELDGIWDENVVTAELARLVNSISRGSVVPRPVVTKPIPFGSASTRMRLTNDADTPLTLTLRFEPHPAWRVEPQQIERVLPPNSVEFADVTVKDLGRLAEGADPGEPIRLALRGEYDPPGEAKFAVDGVTELIVDPMRIVPEITTPVVLDGHLDDWTTLPVEVQRPAEIVGAKRVWRGPQDAHYRFAAARDEKFVYVAVEVKDNQVQAPPRGKPRVGDAVEIWLDPNPASDAENPGLVDSESYVRVILPPERVAEEGESTAPRGASVRTPGGYTAEVAFPIGIIEEKQGKEWETFRVNVAVYDRDMVRRTKNEKKSELWWRPKWDGRGAYPGAGTFLRKRSASPGQE